MKIIKYKYRLSLLRPSVTVICIISCIFLKVSFAFQHVLQTNLKSVLNPLKLSHMDEITHSTTTTTTSNNNTTTLISSSRRQAIGIMATTVASMTMIPSTAQAGKAIIDSSSGQLYSPKADMLGGGGSDLARGIKRSGSSNQK
jgi:uncharacterized membrane protein YfhO